MEKTYVIQTDGGYRIPGSRVSLDSVVYDFLSGLSPESIADNYDSLTLEQVFGAVTYYLAHQAEVEAHLQRNRDKFEPFDSKYAPLIHYRTRNWTFNRSDLENPIPG